MTTKTNNEVLALVKSAMEAAAAVAEREEAGKPTKQAAKQAAKAQAAARAACEAAGFGEEMSLEDVLALLLETNVARGMAGTLARYKPGYQPCVAYSGAESQNNGDALAQALEGKSPDEVMDWAERLLGLETGFLATKYAGLNPGQKRMNSGNRVRAALKRGDLTEAALKATK